MKRIIKIFLILSMFFLTKCGWLFFDCDVFTHFDINSMTAFDYYVAEESGTGHNMRFPVTDSMQVFLFDYLISISFEADYYDLAYAIQNLVSSVYAFDCRDDGYMGSEEKFERIEVISNQDYSDEIKAGESINSLILINDISLEQFLMENRDGISNESFKSNFTQKPDIDIFRSFTIYVDLDNGEKYSDVTKVVKII